MLNVFTIDGIISFRHLKVAVSIFFTITCTTCIASSVDEIKELQTLWRHHAPLCAGYPSSEHCEDGDMTLFSGLLCYSGDPLGCDAVQNAQDATGRWHRSPRLAADPSLRRHNSFSWDMALGVQLYVVRTRDIASLQRWIQWVESQRPCVVRSPNLGGMTYCLVRGWPRWCTDDTEKGCTVKPQNLATLVRTLDALNLPLPSPAQDSPPPGVWGEVLKKLQEESRDANAALSLGNLLEQARGLQPDILLMDAVANRPGYSRHLIGVEIILARESGLDSEQLSIAAEVMALKEKANPFFQFLWEGATERVRHQFLILAPRSAAQIPIKKADWAWQRSEDAQAWKESNLWDFQFLGRLLTGAP